MTEPPPRVCVLTGAGASKPLGLPTMESLLPEGFERSLPDRSGERDVFDMAVNWAALQELNDRERAGVRLRFGLDDGQIRTLEEVGKEFGVTRERIRQIESKTLAKLRHPTRSQRLRDYLEES